MMIKKRFPQAAVGLLFIWLVIGGIGFYNRAVGQENNPAHWLFFDKDDEDQDLFTLTSQERLWLSQHPVISVVQDPGWPPVEFAGPEGQPMGMSNDYLDIIELRLGIKFDRVAHLTWQEAYSRLKSWEIDMTTSVTVTRERLEFWTFTQPYMKIPIVIVTHRDVTYIGHMRELSGKKIAVVDGYAVTDWIPRDYPDIQLIKVKNAREGLERLENGEVFAFIDNMLVIGYYLAKLKISNLKIAGETPYSNAQSMAVRKDWAIFAGILQKALDSITEEERDKIYHRWVPIQYDHGFNYSLLWQALAIFALILAGMAYWNWTLSREIKSRQKVEKALKDSEQLFRTLVEGAPDAIFVQTRERFVYLNQSAVSLLGHDSADQVIGKPVMDYIEPSSRESVRKQLDFLNHHSDAVPVREETIVRPDRSTVLVELSAVQVNFKGERSALVFVRDITERKKMERQLQHAQKMEAIGTLAGGISHDFNNLLQAINGYTQIILLDKNEGDDEYAKLKAIESAGGRAAALVRQLLLFSRKVEARRNTLDLNEQIIQVQWILERTIPKMIRIELKLDRSLWPVYADPIQMEQVLLNLGTNAADAMPEGGTLLIETENAMIDQDYVHTHLGLETGRYVLMSITDTGMGMEQETVEHIFEPFFTTKEIGKGTGLGLASVFGIIKSHGGSILCYSEVGRGTCFKIYLPATEPEPLNHFDGQAAERFTGGTEHILVVDDEKSIRDFASESLRKYGYHVLTAASGEEALRFHTGDTGKIDLVIMDIGMPGMGGLKCLEEFVQFDPNIKIIIASGYPIDGKIRTSIKAGAAEYLGKPYRLVDLLKKVRSVLDR